MLTHVNYKTGYMHDMQALTALTHECGALAIWDLAHSAGAVPVDLHQARADYAIGCTYKYLNGGPGSQAFVWVSPELCDLVAQPLSGWFGHSRQFAMESHYQPSSGIARYLCGTQPITSLAMIECGLDVFAQTDMASLRSKSLALTDLFIQLVEQRCAAHELTLVTPREHAKRGSHVSFEHPQGYAVIQALIARGVIGDYREPRIMRFGFTRCTPASPRSGMRCRSSAKYLIRKPGRKSNSRSATASPDTPDAFVLLPRISRQQGFGRLR